MCTRTLQFSLTQAVKVTPVEFLCDNHKRNRMWVMKKQDDQSCDLTARKWIGPRNGQQCHCQRIYYTFIIINNNNNHDDIYSAVIIAEPLREFTRFTHWIQKQSQVAADANRLQPQARLYRQPVNSIQHRHLLSLLSPKADTHFTVPRRVEGWVDLGGCYIPRWFTRP